jgi:enamine deaminase RidA (YjgF/YER057c/UK114 family)
MRDSDSQEASVSGNSLHSGSKNYSSNDDGSDGHSISGSSTTGTSLAGSSRVAPTKEEEIARREDKAVAYSRALVLGVLLVSATVAGVVTWIVSTNAEKEDFQTQVRPAYSSFRKLAYKRELTLTDVLLSVSLKILLQRSPMFLKTMQSLPLG